MRPIVFLDFDGVVMTEASYTNGLKTEEGPERERRHAENRLDPECVRWLSILCTMASAEIVLSTAWRGPYGDAARRAQLAEALWNRGLSREVPVVGETPHGVPGQDWVNGEAPQRGAEIKAWLDEHRPGWDRSRIVILDDDGDQEPLMDRWVRSWFRPAWSPEGRAGFGRTQCLEACDLLSVPYNPHVAAGNALGRG